jgi:hypothetical protein
VAEEYGSERERDASPEDGAEQQVKEVRMIMQPDSCDTSVDETPPLRCLITHMISSDPSRIRSVLNLGDPEVRKLVVEELLNSEYADDVSLSKENMNRILGIT